MTENKEKRLIEWENITPTKQEVTPPIMGETGVIGIGFTKMNDFVAAGVLTKRGAKYVFKQHTWICTSSEDLPNIKFPYMGAVAAGDAEIVDEREIAPELIADWVAKQASFYNINMVVIDSYYFVKVKEALARVGFTYENGNIKLMRQRDRIKIEPIVDSEFRKHNIIYGDCPIMRWYTENAQVQEKYRKTEGFLAFVAAMTQHELLTEKKADGKKLREIAEKYAIEIMEKPNRTQQEVAILPQLLELLLGGKR